MQTKPVLKAEIDFNHLSKEATEILKILDEIENRTAELRRKLMTELKSNKSAVHIKLDNV